MSVMRDGPNPTRTQPDLSPLVDDDLRAIVKCVLDLTYYRKVPQAGDRHRQTARDLLDRVKALPDHR